MPACEEGVVEGHADGVVGAIVLELLSPNGAVRTKKSEGMVASRTIISDEFKVKKKIFDCPTSNDCELTVHGMPPGSGTPSVLAVAKF